MILSQSLSSSAISMEVQVMSDMKTVLDVAPYNNHTVKCNVSHDSFARISGTLMFLFISKEISLHSENKTVSQPGPFVVLSNVSENTHGLVHHYCNVTLIVDEVIIDSKLSQTTMEVVGKCHVFVIQLCFDVHFGCPRLEASCSSRAIALDHFNY